MQLIRSILLTASLPIAALANYTLTKDYSGYDFTGGFDYYNGPDPTNGHVQYKGYATANTTGLTGFLVGPNGTNIANATLPPPIYLGVDHENTYPSNVGRPSVRVSSVQTYNHSLIIADIQHMPTSTCGLWPAFWMLGTSATWPNAGEIDIIENVNDNKFNLMTLHTNAGITVSNSSNLFTGTLKTSNCDVNAKGQDKNVGCSIKDKPETNSYGTQFNQNGGGIFAMQYTPEYIAIWFFPRKSIPTDITSNSPRPPLIKNSTNSTWGKPSALFMLSPSLPPRPTSSTKSSLSATPTPTGNVIVPISSSVSTSTSTSSGSKSTSTSSTTVPKSAPSSNLTSHFASLQILFSTTFCGDWAGKTWNTTACSKLAPTCEEYVSKHPEAFKDAFWAIQSVKVYEQSKGETPKIRHVGLDTKMEKRGLEEHGKRGVSEYMVKRFGREGLRIGKIMPFRDAV